jgi:hypothetical protein
VRILKTIYKILIALAIGAISTLFFNTLYVVVAHFDVKYHFLKWTFILPEMFQVSAGIFTAEIIAAFPVILIAGIIIGILVESKPVFFGLISVAGSFICKNIIMLENIGHYYRGTTIWFELSSIVLWIFLFIFMTKLGTIIHLKGLHLKRPRGFTVLFVLFAYLTIAGIVTGLHLATLYGSIPGILGFCYGLSALAVAIGLWLFQPWTFHATIIFSLSILLWLFNYQYGLNGKYTLPLHFFILYVIFICLLLVLLVYYIRKKFKEAVK